MTDPRDVEFVLDWCYKLYNLAPFRADVHKIIDTIPGPMLSAVSTVRNELGPHMSLGWKYFLVEIRAFPIGYRCVRRNPSGGFDEASPSFATADELLDYVLKNMEFE